MTGMKKVIFPFLAALSIFFLSCNNGDSGKTFTIKPKLKAGDLYSLECRVDINYKFSSGSGADAVRMDNDMMVAMGFLMKIKEITPEQDINMNLMYKRIAMTMNSPAGSYSYDSNNPYENEDRGGFAGTMEKALRASFSGLLNKSMQVSLDKDGKVKKVTGFKEIVQSIRDSAKGKLVNTETIEKNMGEKQVNQLFDQTFGVFPKKPVSVGDTWEVVFSQDMEGVPLKSTSTLRLVQVSDNKKEAVINVNSKLSSSGTSTKDAVKIDMYGTQTGTLIVDLVTGVFKHGTLTQDLKANMMIGGEKVPLTVHTVTSLKGRKF